MRRRQGANEWPDRSRLLFSRAHVQTDCFVTAAPQTKRIAEPFVISLSPFITEIRIHYLCQFRFLNDFPRVLIIVDALKI